MTVWGIADLHLSFARPDRTDRLAARWRDHAAKIERGWRDCVGPGDLVLIPGDVSTAGNHREVQPDLAWLDRLPGTKVLAPGNHDRWWNRVDAVRPMLRRSLRAVEGDALATHGVIVLGARGVAPTAESQPGQGPAVARELAALDRATAAALALRTGDEPLFLLWHYPPFDQNRRPGPAVPRIEAAGVSHCVYGHLHAEGQWSNAVQGAVGPVRYHCVAADAVGFRPLRLADID